METIVAKHIDKVNKFHKKYGKAIVLILNEDRYFAYNEDAEIISKSVGIALLTSMDKDYQFVVFDDTMLDVYKPRLVREGHRVVILESLHDRVHDAYWLEKQSKNKPNLDVEIPFGYKDSELEEASYNIPNGYHAEIEDNKVVIKKGEQKPAWSEEYEYLLDETIKHLEALIRITKKHGSAYSDEIQYYQRDIDWFKSLKDRVQSKSTWKPSEEQMKALKEAVDEHFDIDGGALWHLYQDLKNI